MRLSTPVANGADDVTTIAQEDALRLSRGRAALVWIGSVATWGLLLFSYRYLGVLAEGEWEPFLPKFIDEMTGGATIGLLFFPCRAFVRRWPLARGTWRRHAPYYVVALLAFAASATTLDRLTGEYTDENGSNILDLFYKDMTKHAFELQITSLATRRRIIKESLDYLHNIQNKPEIQKSEIDSYLTEDNREELPQSVLENEWPLLRDPS